jgi:ElaA protein
VTVSSPGDRHDNVAAVAPENSTIRRRRAAELSTLELHDLLRLRVDVFVVEQDCAYHELDGRDLVDGTEHWWIECDGAIASSIRLIAHESGGTRVGRVVTHRSHRGAGLAATLITAAVAEVERPIHLDAQAHLRAWYEQLGFEVCGPLFVEDGIDHLPMVMR